MPEYSLKLNRKTGTIYATHRAAKEHYKTVVKAQLPPIWPILNERIGLSVRQYRKAKKKGVEGESCIDKPDFSNVLKLVEDILTGLVYVDDKLISDYESPMFKAYDSDNPRVEIDIYVYK